MTDRTCNRCKSPLSSRQVAFCSHRCANATSAHAKSLRSKAAERKSCDVDGCDKLARSRTADLCPMHYHRVYRYGTLEKTRALVARGERTPPRAPDPIAGKRFGTLTVVERQGSRWRCQCDCGEIRTTGTGDLNRYGEANTCGVKANHLAPVVGYSGAHDRVRRARGRVESHPCSDCHGPARHWSYNHDDPDELHSDDHRTEGIAYSLDPNHYRPRCVPCHKRFDLGRLDAAQHHGHAIG